MTTWCEILVNLIGVKLHPHREQPQQRCDQTPEKVNEFQYLWVKKTADNVK